MGNNPFSDQGSNNGSTSYSSNIDQDIINYNRKMEEFIKCEQYFGVIKDSNKTKLIEENFASPNKKKLEIFFSLIDVENKSFSYSFSLTIINNAEIVQRSYLGELEPRFGKNIDFGNSFEIDYFQERKQILIIKPKINGSPLKYEITLTVEELVQKRNYDINLANIGSLRLSFTELNYNMVCHLEKFFSKFYFDMNLTNMNNTSKGIFFILNHYKDSDKKRMIYKSPLYNDVQIKTNEIKIELDFLCQNINEEISIDLYQVEHFNRPFAYGKLNLNQLILNAKNNSISQITLFNVYNNAIIGNSNVNFFIEQKLSFSEKLKNKSMQINLEIAIDYTYSNKPPSDPKSLHHLDLNELNDYEIAMKYCGNILAQYDADQLFPVYGFGGIPQVLNGVPNDNYQVSHCFNINFEQNAEIQGIDAVLRFYRESLSRITLSGNTKFSFVLRKVISNIIFDLKNKKYENHYYILLILTDGAYNDIDETKNLIVEASSLPLSIIIVGIGENGDFTLMEDLDADENPLTDPRGQIRKRDIVQFIEFNKFKKNNSYMNGSDFAEEVLKEIPRQIDEYYSLCGKFYMK